MTIGIIVAMSKELELFKPLLNNREEENDDGYTFITGEVGCHRVVLMQCGIAKVNAAIGTLTLLNRYRVDMVINTGVAGGANQSVNVMDVVAAERVAYHDVYCGPENQLGAVQGLPLYYSADPRLLDALPEGGSIKRGLTCSGDQFIDTLAQVESIRTKFPQVLAVDMESAAIAQVCHLKQVPFMSLRVISDSPGAGHDNTLQYDDFWAAAPEQTFHVVKQMLERLHG